MARTIFWNVDTQYDFMRQNGKLYVPGAETIENNLETITRYAKTHGIKVVNTGDWHDNNSKEFSDNPDYVNTFKPHCIKNTPGAEYVGATKPEGAYVIDWDQKSIDTAKIRDTRNIVIHKDAFDVFDTKNGNPYTNEILHTINPEQVIVYGVATNYCVKDAVAGLVKNGIDVFVVSDAVKEIQNGTLEETLKNWDELGVKQITTEHIGNYVKF